MQIFRKIYNGYFVLVNQLIFRKIKKEEIGEVLDIYNYHIENGLANFEENTLNIDIFIKLYEEILDLNLPFLVCEEDKKIIGFAFLNKFRNKSGYKYTYENSIYMHKDAIGRGIGSKLLKELIVESSATNIKTIIAVIGGKNSQASVNIHKKNGFNMIGTLQKVGFKKNQWLDIIYMQIILNEKN